MTQTTASLAIAALLIVNFGCKPDAQSANVPDDSAATSQADGIESAAVEPPTLTKAAAESEPVSEDESVVISGPLGSVDWSALVGKDITIDGDLVIVDTYDLIRRGQVKVARNRLFIPTSSIDPNDSDADENSFEGGSNVAQVTAAQKANDLATVILDDGSAKQNVFPPTLFPELGKTYSSVRTGSVINGFSGRLVRAGSVLLLTSNEPADWKPAARPEPPTVGDANVTVASFNVLNYFTTLDDGSNNARGADSLSELERQEEKIVSAIMSLDADVLGLMELENNVDAENRLVAALNERAETTAFQACGIPDGFDDSPGGGDSIRVGIIYRSDRVKTVGGVGVIRDNAFSSARAPVVQTFEPTGGGDSFTVIVNHFKSKGGSDRADVANKNKGDGQGAFNAARRSQALAICGYVNGLQEKVPGAKVLVIGDLNAYQQEDPIDALRANGMVDLHERFHNSQSGESDHANYSYVYYGQSGSLDHALATKALADSVTGVATWHINSDEPRFLDYNEEFNPKLLFEPDPYRSSDHDPVLIGIGG